MHAILDLVKPLWRDRRNKVTLNWINQIIIRDSIYFLMWEGK